MQTETLNRIYQYYLRFVGLSCHSDNKYVEYLLIAYHLLIVCHDLYDVFADYAFDAEIEPELEAISNFVNFLEIAIFKFYKTMRVLFCIRAILGRKMEKKILQNIQGIQDDFQLKLFFNYESSKYFSGIFYKYFWLCDICWHMLLLAYIWYFENLLESLANYRFTFTLQAIKAVYVQFVLLIMKIDEQLENLEKCLKINLQRQEHQQQQQQQQHQQQQEIVKHPPEIINFINNECITLSVLALVDEGKSFNYVPAEEMKPYLLQRIWTMNCIYGKILKLTKTCSAIFGLSILLTNFLCLWDFSEMMYIMVSLMNDGSFPVKTALYGLYCVMPSLMILIMLCWCSEKCSQRAINISKQLKMSPSHAIFIDDFILQIVQNPIKFSAYNFYNLNLNTLFVIFVMVFEFLMIFLQLFFLTRVV